MGADPRAPPVDLPGRGGVRAGPAAGGRRGAADGPLRGHRRARPEPVVTDTPTVAVVGAVNVDLVVRLARVPAPGETVTDGTFSRHQGGKGGKQAGAAAPGRRGRGEGGGGCCGGNGDLGR